MGILTIDVGYGHAVKYHEVLKKIIKGAEEVGGKALDGDVVVLKDLASLINRAIEQRDKLTDDSRRDQHD